jgi:hypothetical protein
LTNIYNLTNYKLDLKPYKVYYTNSDKSYINVNSVITKSHNIVPVIEEKIKISEIEKLGLKYDNVPLIDKLDNDIINNKININNDDRTYNVNKDTYQTESYELFRLELSNYLNKHENQYIKKNIQKIINNNKFSIIDKTENIRLILYKLIDPKLYDKYKQKILNKNINIETQIIDSISTNISSVDNTQNMTGGKYDKIIHILNEEPRIDKYNINNDRITCNQLENCEENIHCKSTRSGCYMALTLNLIIKFINKISDELSLNDRKSFEILKIDNYYVSDVVDFNKFTSRPGQKIIRSTGSNIKKTLGEIFGEDNIPVIGKKKIKTTNDGNFIQLNQDNPLTDMKEYFIQRIINNKLSVIRAYVNGYYWNENSMNEPEVKNLGFYSPIQTTLTNYFRGKIIEWVNNNKNKQNIDNISKYINIKNLSEYVIKLGSSSNNDSNFYIELVILSIINQYPIVVYNDLNTPIFVFNNGLLFDNRYDKIDKIKNILENKSNNINIRMLFSFNSDVPEFIEAIYFKK